MCAAFRSHRKSATSSGSRSRPSARQFNRDVLTLDEAATPYERGPHCASQQIKLRNVPFGSEAAIGGGIFSFCFSPPKPTFVLAVGVSPFFPHPPTPPPPKILS